MAICGRTYATQYAAALAATIVSIVTGVSIAWPSPSVPRLISGTELPYAVSATEASYIAIITSLANVVGSPIAGWLVDAIGRKRTILLIALPQIVAFLLIYLSSNSVILLYIARFLNGIADGAVFTVLAIYIGEISEPCVRGALGSLVSLTLRVGMLLINVIGSYCTIAYTSLICLALPGLFLITFIQMPESPYYLLMQNRRRDALQALRFLRRREDVETELNAIASDVARQLSESGKFADLFTIKSNLKACIIIVGLRTIQQFSGISAFTLYTQQLFKSAAGHLPPHLAANIFSLIQLVLTFVSSLLVDVTGRKPLLIFSCITCFVVLVVEGVYFALRDFTHVLVVGEEDDALMLNWLPLTGMILYIILFSVGLGSIVNLMLGELFNQSVKAKALCVMNIYFALVMGGTTKFFQVMHDSFGLAIPFFVFGACCGFGALFCALYVPETKGKTLEEIQQVLKGNTKRRSHCQFEQIQVY